MRVYRFTPIVVALLPAFAQLRAKSVNITPDTLPGGTAGTPYSQTLKASGCSPGCFWSSSGQLPPGLALGPGNGVIDGTPSTAGTFRFTVMAVDLKLDSGSQSYSLNIKPDPPAITTSSPLPGGQVGAPYSQTLAASGGKSPYSWSVASGKLPSGLSLSPSGALTGTPTTADVFTFTVQVADADRDSATKAFSLTITAPVAPLTIATTSLPGGTVGVSYSQSVAATGGRPPYSWNVTAGAPPPGVSLDSSSGRLAGTPSSAGTFSFTVQVSDASGATANKALSATITAATPPLTVTTTSLPGGTVGVSYSQSITATGGAPPYSWRISSGSLPPGLSLDPSSGNLTGTPSSADSFSFTVQVSDSGAATASKALSVAIAAPAPALTINTSSLPGGTVGISYAQSVAASGGKPPYTWSVISGSLPKGLSLGAADGNLTGTPSAADSYVFTVQVSDSTGATASKKFTVTVASNTPGLTIVTTSLPDGTVGTNYSQPLTASGGTPPYQWTVTSGALPGGLALDSGSGTISGTPKSAGAFPFTVRVTDSASGVADQALQITIGKAPSVPTLSLTGVPDTATSGQQSPISVVLSAAAKQTVTGQITLSFQPDATAKADDPAIQFANGSRTAPFTIPAGATKAVFPMSPMALQTGTVAGTITLSVSSDLSGSNFTRSVAVGRAAPVIQSATIVTTSSGFQVKIAGFSNTRDLSTAKFHFTAATGQALQTSDLSVSLAAPASQWYSGNSSTQFGGQFLLVVPFTVAQGAPTGLSTVSIQLANGQSTSATATANF